MITHAEYCGICVCGKEFATTETQFVCSKCKRQSVIEWSAEAAEIKLEVEPGKVVEMKRRVA